MLQASRAGADLSTRAVGLLPRPLTRVEIPYEGITLPGWWVPADDAVPDPRSSHLAQAPDNGDDEATAPRERPVLLFHGGFDSRSKSCTWPAARRGYHALLFEGSDHSDRVPTDSSASR